MQQFHQYPLTQTRYDLQTREERGRAFFYANEAVYVTGDLDQTDEDRLMGIPWLPTARIYVTNNREWGENDTLVDVTPGGYNVITGTLLGGGFIGEIVWLPPLTVGKYDLVIDENQNGIFDSDPVTGVHDYVLGEGTDYAFEVRSAIGPPTINKSKIKADAQELANFWRLYPLCLDWSFTVIGFTETALSFAIAGWPTIWSLGIGLVTLWDRYVSPIGYNSAVTSIGMKIIRGLAGPLHDHYLWRLIPRILITYTVFAELGPIKTYPVLEESSFVIAQTNLANNLAQQDAILQALTSSIEKYEGAKAARNDTYVLLQAKAIKKFSDMLVANYKDAVQLLDIYASEVEKMGGNKTIYAADVINFQQRNIGFRRRGD